MNEDMIKLNYKDIQILKAIYKMFKEDVNIVDNCSIQFIKKYTAEDILVAREERVNYQEKLLNKYNNTLINVRVNYPGIAKNNYVSFGIIKEICSLIIREFEDIIVYKFFSITAEGPIVTVVVKKNSLEVKYKTINIEENHFLGRYVDIDVYHKSGRNLSRKELSLHQRKCYICDEFAQNCVRTGKHNISEIEQFIKDKYEKYYNLLSK